MQIIISDASVLIDIEQAELISAMFMLPYQFCVPDILFFEELSERHDYLLEFGLDCRSMNGELIAEAYHLRQQYVRPSVNDLLALVLAKFEKCQLLTGDKALRELANALGVEIHGTIWLVEQMILHQILSNDVAESAFHKMKEQGSRLPWDKVHNLLKKYDIYKS